MRTVGSRSRSLVTWLLIAQAVVLCVTAVVATVAAAVIGPPLFHEHLHLAGSDTSGSTFDHVEEAFRSAGLLTLGAALLAAIAAAGLVTVVLGRRLTGPLQDLASAATRVADGHYGATVAQPTRLSELAAVGTAFNRMSAQLASTEQVRQQIEPDTEALPSRHPEGSGRDLRDGFVKLFARRSTGVIVGGVVVFGAGLAFALRPQRKK